MTQLDDLTAALAQLQTDVADAAARVVTALSATPPDLTAALAAVAAIDTSAKAIDAPPNA